MKEEYTNQQRRWYDKDPVLSQAVNTLEHSDDETQIKIALNLIKIIIEHNIENEKQYSGELAKEAINKAKIIAGFTANTLNQKLSGVKSISVNISSQNNFEPRYASMKSNPKSQQ